MSFIEKLLEYPQTIGSLRLACTVEREVTVIRPDSTVTSSELAETLEHREIVNVWSN